MSLSIEPPQKMLPNAFNQSNRYTQFDQANRSSNCVPNDPKSSLLVFSPVTESYTLDIDLYLCISPPYMRNIHVEIYIRVLKQCLIIKYSIKLVFLRIINKTFSLYNLIILTYYLIKI